MYACKPQNSRFISVISFNPFAAGDWFAQKKMMQNCWNITLDEENSFI